MPRRPDLEPVPAVKSPAPWQPLGGVLLPLDDREMTQHVRIDREGEVVLERDPPQDANDVLRVARQERRDDRSYRIIADAGVVSAESRLVYAG